MARYERQNDEFPESRRCVVYAKNKTAAVEARLLHFPRAELIEATTLKPARKGHLGKYRVSVSEDYD
jgi:hypothetical protein